MGGTAGTTALARPPDGEGGTPQQAAPSKPSLPPGLVPAALDELRSAAATYDYLRSTGDSPQFWEALRLARNHRGLAPASAAGSSLSPGEAAAIREELQLVRERLSGLVAGLRAFLTGCADLPQPGERLEMALAFLLASFREHEAVAGWLREPEKSRRKAADKLRSLASISDPYLEALRPWSPERQPPGPNPSPA